MNINLILYLTIYSNECLAQWTLVWNDEFNGNQLDYNKWSVTNGKDINEATDSEVVLSYSRDNNNTINFKNGLLALTVVQENYFDRNFTSATINSKKSFLYGRIDVRAALPQGMLLKTSIVLQPVKNVYGNGKDRADGEIELVADMQLGFYLSRISHINLFDAMDSYPFSVDFQVYSLQWNETQISWWSNDTLRRTFDLDEVLDTYYKKKGQPFDKEFYLSMRFHVIKFEDEVLLMDESFYKNWKCPLLLIDYVRIYQTTDSTQMNTNSQNLTNSKETKEDICRSVNQKLEKFYANSNSASSLKINHTDDSDYVLVWNDEFNDTKLDYEKWWVTDGKDILEELDNERVLSSSRDSDHNIQLSDGILALSATQESYMNRSFTAAHINSNFSFLYGRLDVRAAIPSGALLKTAIVLLPEKNEYDNRTSKANGEIELVADVQIGDFYSRVSYSQKFDAQKTYPTNDDFQVYSVDWNSTQITWLLNGSVRHTSKLDRIIDKFYKENGQPFDKKFYLSIRLQVMKLKASESVIDDNHHQKWKCPSLLIDYVRVYQRADTTVTPNQLQQPVESNVTKDVICRNVNEKSKGFYKNTYNKVDLSFIWTIGVPVFAIIISIILVIIIIVLIKKKKQQSETDDKFKVKYKADYEDEDEHNYQEIYDEVPNVNQYEMVDYSNSPDHNYLYLQEQYKQEQSVTYQLYDDHHDEPDYPKLRSENV